MSEDRVLVSVPVGVAVSLVEDGAATYPPRTRDAGATVTTAIAVLGVATDVVSLTLAREAVADLIRRLTRWGHTRGDQSELTLRIDHRVDLRVRMTGDDSEERLLAVADAILAELRVHE